MYDKSNSLRIEVTINDPKDFKIYKEVESKDGTTTKKMGSNGKEYCQSLPICRNQQKHNQSIY